MLVSIQVACIGLFSHIHRSLLRQLARCAGQLHVVSSVYVKLQVSFMGLVFHVNRSHICRSLLTLEMRAQVRFIEIWDLEKVKAALSPLTKMVCRSKYVYT